MIHHYLKIAFRNLFRQKFYSLINIFGLGIGLACTVLIGLYLDFEFSFDSMHPDVDRTYRVNQTNIWYPEQGAMSSTGLPLAKVLADDFVEIESSMRINTPYSFTIRYEDELGIIKAFNEDDFLAADSNFFDFFNIKLKEGNPRTALKGLNKVVISNKIAEKLFGDQPGLGKIILMGDDRIPIEVTGVTEPQPENIHFDFDYLISIYTNPNVKQFEWSWIWTQAVTYIKVREGTDVSALEAKMSKVTDLHVAPSFKRFGIDFNEFIKGNEWNFYLQPVRDIHLYSAGAGNRIGPVGDITYMYIFSIIGIFILIIAVINFINLSTARASTREREIGVKKVMGSTRKSLVFQFLNESLLITFMGAIAGLAIMELIRLISIQYIGVSLPFSLWEEPYYLLLLPAIIFIVGILAGLYPAIYLTSRKPVSMLKSKSGGTRKSSLRNLLVVVQFTISIALIASTLIVYKQLKFFSTTDLGYNQNNVLVINNAYKLGTHLTSVREEIESYNSVMSASITMASPGRIGFEDIFSREGWDEKVPMSMLKCDEDYLEMMQLKMISGRWFEQERGSDRNSVVINEAAARLFGWDPGEALHQKIIYTGDDLKGSQVIGVVGDFHFQTLKAEISPLVIYNDKSDVWGDSRVILVRYKPENMNYLVEQLSTIWKDFLPDSPFEFSYLEEELSKDYQFEQQLGGLFGLFTGLSIIVALIGLLGLVAYSTDQRKKEIGIRKVLGASVSKILVLINGNFLKLILIGFIAATPLSWWAMQEWLNTFPYRIEITLWIFLVAGSGAALLSLICIGYLSLRAASLNPAEVLKEE